MAKYFLKSKLYNMEGNESLESWGAKLKNSAEDDTDLEQPESVLAPGTPIIRRHPKEKLK